MCRRTDYADEPLQIGERVKGFLPSSSELIKREETITVTIELKQE